MERLTPWLTRTRMLYAGLALMLAAGAVWFGGRAGGAGSFTVPTGTVMSPMATMAAPPAEPGPLVHVVGAVRHPGLYRLAPGARTMAAVRRAGGATRAADLAAINLAAVVSDGQQIVVPVRGGAGQPVTGAPGVTTGGPVSLSTASADQLETLDGIGPTLAQHIIGWRTDHGGFTSVDQLLDVPGIGPAKLAAIRDRVTP
ncbi:MAG: ComEA family DNA-binding protein [Thermoleophilia bacterium]